MLKRERRLFEIKGSRGYKLKQVMRYRDLAEWRISLVKVVVSTYAGGPTKSGYDHVVGGGSWTGHIGVRDVW